MRFLLALLFCLTSFTAQAKVYEKDYFGEQVEYRAKFEDTLIHLARNNGLGFVELRSANPKLDPWIPGEGVKIILPQKHILPDAPRKGLVINLAEMRIFYFKNPGEPPLTFPISIGRDGLQTPVGQTKIVRKTEGPTWRPTPRMREENPDLPEVVPPGPDNPLGTHALYLGWPQYLIHGTNKPYGIGRRVSSGCMRMYPEQVKELYPIVPVGTPVTVVDQPVKVGWIDGDLYIEVSPTQEQSLKIEEGGKIDTYEISKEDIQRINEKAGPYADKLNWRNIRQAVKEHRGYPVKILDKNVRPQSYSRQTKIEDTKAVQPVTRAEEIKEEVEIKAIKKNTFATRVRESAYNN
jgi:L,D-transpeptidase ErfK/SrfK